MEIKFNENEKIIEVILVKDDQYYKDVKNKRIPEPFILEVLEKVGIEAETIFNVFCAYGMKDSKAVVHIIPIRNPFLLDIEKYEHLIKPEIMINESIKNNIFNIDLTQYMGEFKELLIEQEQLPEVIDPIDVVETTDGKHHFKIAVDDSMIKKVYKINEKYLHKVMIIITLIYIDSIIEHNNELREVVQEIMLYRNITQGVDIYEALSNIIFDCYEEFVDMVYSDKVMYYNEILKNLKSNYIVKEIKEEDDGNEEGDITELFGGSNETIEDEK